MPLNNSSMKPSSCVTYSLRHLSDLQLVITMITLLKVTWWIMIKHKLWEHSILMTNIVIVIPTTRRTL